jgi:hypothetical protein
MIITDSGSLFGESFLLEFKNPGDNDFNLGEAMFSKTGPELASLYKPQMREDFKNYATKQSILPFFNDATLLRFNFFGRGTTSGFASILFSLRLAD